MEGLRSESSKHGLLFSSALFFSLFELFFACNMVQILELLVPVYLCFLLKIKTDESHSYFGHLSSYFELV